MSALTGGAGMFGKLLQGYAQGKMFKEGKDERLVGEKLKQDLIKLQIQKEKTVQQQNQMKLQFLNQYFQQQGQKELEESKPKSESTPMGESFGESSGGVSGKIADQSLANMDPFIAEFLGFGGAQRAATTQKHYGVIEEQAEKRYEQQKRANDLRERALTESVAGFTEEKIPGVGTVRKPYTKVGGVKPYLSEPSQKDMPIPASDMPLWVHPDTLSNPQVGMTPKQAETAGFKKMSTGQIDAVKSFGTVEGVLGQVEGLMQKVFPTEESSLGRVSGAIQRQGGASLQTNIEASTLDSLINGTLAPIVRSLGEKGNLSDTDIKRARKLFPNLTDRADVAWRKLSELKDLISNAKRARLGVETIPPSVANQLKEGVQTQFKNGQVWTLQNGKPARVK